LGAGVGTAARADFAVFDGHGVSPWVVEDKTTGLGTHKK
jgi:hypothetical protein